MLANWIYSHPTWIVGSVIVGLFVLLSCIGLAIVQRLVPVRLRRPHNDIVGFTIAVVGVVYAVLLAFIAVATWETFRKGDNVVASEANYVGDVFRNTIGLPDNLARQLRGHLDQYIDVVIGQEWPAQQAGRLEEASWQKGWELLADVHFDIAHFRPANAGEAVLQGQLLRSLNSLYDARRGRLLAAKEHVTPVIWWIIAFGAMLTVGCTYLFGPPNFKMHVVITSMLAASLAVVMVLIVALDYPFRGSLSVSDEAFRDVKKNMETLVFQHR
jgi:Protein of unknown function (DUF4239)